MRPRTAVPVFRWVKPAASLKLAEARAHLSEMVHSFRWVKPAASLKHRDRHPGLPNVTHVSAG